MHDDSFDFERTVKRFLATSRTASLATVDERGRPCSCNIQYAQDDQLNLYFVSNDTTQHAQNIKRASYVAMSVYAHDDRAGNIHGLQIRGKARALQESAACNQAYELYVDKFTFVAAMPQYEKVLREQTFYCVTPYWMRWIDNRKTFGWKVEKEF